MRDDNQERFVIVQIEDPEPFVEMDGIEEGTYFQSYTFMGYGGMNRIYMLIVLRELCCYIEGEGYEAVPVPNYYSCPNISISEQRPAPGCSVSVAPGLPNPDILVDFRIAAFTVGLGQIGYSKIFLTPEYGPMERFVVLLTDAELEPDQIYEGTLCDRCIRCVGACSGKAISPHETVRITVAGRKVEWGKLDWLKCSVAYKGGSYEYNPFLSKDAKLEELTPDEYCGGSKLLDWVGYLTVEGNNPALEGARGCIRECYIHLEETGRLAKAFHQKFRQHKPWRLDRSMLGRDAGGSKETMNPDGPE